MTPPCRCDEPALGASELERWFAAPFPLEVSAVEGVSDAPPRVEDMVEVACHSLGRGDGPSWIALAKLRDGRWCYVSYSLAITGDIIYTAVLAATKHRLWWYACSDDDRERFTRQLTGEQLDEELVQIDELLESEDPARRALGEKRMLQRHKRAL